MFSKVLRSENRGNHTRSHNEPFSLCLLGAVAVVTDLGNQDPSSANSRPVSPFHKLLLAHTDLLTNAGSFPPLCFGQCYTPLQGPFAIHAGLHL